MYSDVTEPGMYAGSPLQPLKQYMKNTAYVRKLDELNKRVKELEQSLSVMR
jgi:UDP-3-O-[3-hydroxymyristoyl] glucosamine N-acyltransferase